MKEKQKAGLCCHDDVAVWGWNSVGESSHASPHIFLGITCQPLTCLVLWQVLWFGWEKLLQVQFRKMENG
jgi:hypothetical protein